MCFITSGPDNRLEQLVTEFAKTLPPNIFIHNKQLKILESVGQGEHSLQPSIAHMISQRRLQNCVIFIVNDLDK